MVKHYQGRLLLNFWKGEVGKETIFACVESEGGDSVFVDS